MAWYRCVGGAGGSLKLRTASGRIATFSTNMVAPFNSLKTDINPVQDLHGYTKPWSGGAGKNKLNYDAWKTSSIANGTAVWENNGVKLTATSNDCYTSAPSGFPVSARIPVTEGETITLSWEETANADGSIYIFPNNTTTGMVRGYNQQVKKLSYTATSGITYITFRFGVSNSGTTIAYKNIQIEKGSTATAWEPYSNICPISGFSGANIVVADENMVAQSTTNIPFGQEVYGGVLDVTNGKLTITHGYVDLGNLTWTNKGGGYFVSDDIGSKNTDNNVKADAICSNYEVVSAINLSSVYPALAVGWNNNAVVDIRDTDYTSYTGAQFQTAMSGVQLVYELATPTEITLTPKQIEALLGINNVYHDCNGETEVKYLYRE